MRAQNQGKPFVLGEVREINSVVLSETRTLNIYLPGNYDEQDTMDYAVLYVLDGSSDEDFVHICGLVQFFNMMEMMPPTIVVGIANVDRRRDFTFPTNNKQDKIDFPTTGGSEKFIGFIGTELQPYIERTYRTTETKALIGQSLGGLLATEILFQQPALFTDYIIVSPSLWWDDESLLAVVPQLPIRPTSVYIAVGDEDDQMEAEAKQLHEMLQHYEKNMNVEFEFLGDEDHATILHHAVYNAFKKMFTAK